MAGALSAMIAAAFAGGGAAVSDPYFEYTTLLLPGNGTNGAQNNTFLDSSTNNFTITRNGNTTQGTFSPFSQTGWGNYFDGSTAYLSTPYTTDFNFGTGDFTIEAWIYTNSVSGSRGIVGISNASPSDGIVLRISNNNISFWVNGYGSAVTGSQTITTGVWYHVALVRNGSTNTIYLNGSSIGSNTQTTAIGTPSIVVVGRTYANNSSEYFDGYISNVRIVKGTAVYTANFTPSTTPLTAISGTSLLTCQSNRFIDTNTQTTAKTITPNGSPSVQAFSPFNPSASWSAATYGGSGYFDGNNDYLSVAYNSNLQLGSSDFTIDFWFYSTGAQGGGDVLANGYSTGSTLSWLIQADVSTIKLYLSTTGSGWAVSAFTVGAIVHNSWNHYAITRSGNTVTPYLNGTAGSTTSITGSIFANTSPIGIGSDVASPSAYAIQGYLTDFRIIIGSAVAPPSGGPTSPATAVTNTRLLLNYTNAGIYDATSKNDLETVDGAKISTAISAKWGTGSMYFDGTGDYLVWPSSQTLIFGTADFTIEMWVNRSSTQNSVSTLFAQSPGSTYFVIHNNDPSYVNRITVYVDNYGAGTRVLTGGTTLSADTWYHVAITRASGVWRLFVNGTSDSSTYTNTANPTPSGSVNLIGARSTSSPLPFTGYIQDARITTGYARYTTNFTPPTAAFPTL